MRHGSVVALAVVTLAVSSGVRGQSATPSVCSYDPPESRVSDLSIAGSLTWFDGPYSDDRERAVAANLVADFTGLTSSASFGRTLDGHAEVRGTTSGWSADLAGSGTLRSFLREDLFVVAALGLDGSSRSTLELDLSGGVGSGRFRDVTPLARAIRIQDALLDLGELLAPIGSAALLDIAQVLGEVGPTDDERVIRVVDRIVETELLSNEDLGVQGLLTIEEILEENNGVRYCGRDVQVRVGGTARLLPTFSLSGTGTLLARYAAVPDPVSQVESSLLARFRLVDPSQMSVEADLSYARLLPDGWTASAEYRFAIDRMWTDPTETAFSHALSAGLTTKVFGSIGLQVACNAEYHTGDEEITLNLTIHVEADLL